MTEHRVMYITSIPVEEKCIRLELARQRHLLKLNKERLSNERFEDMIIIYKICIAQIKAVIKALKKQLPVRGKLYETKYLTFCSCPICNWNNNSNQNYCGHCGQRLYTI